MAGQLHFRSSGLGLAGLMAAFLWGPSCGGPGGDSSDDQLVIGSIISDDVDDESRSEIDAVRLAIEEFNASGVFEKELVLVNRTCSSGDTVDPQKATQAVRDLYDQDGAIAFISNLGGQQVFPMVEVTNTPACSDFVQCNSQSEDPVINIPGMSGADETDAFYRTVSTFAIQIDVGALVFLERGWLKIGLVRLDDEFGQQVSFGLRLKIGELSGQGATLVFDKTVPYGSFDLEANREMLDEVISASHADEVDVTILAVFQAQGPGVVKYLTESGYTGALWLTVASKTPEMFQIATGIQAWQEQPGNVMTGIEPDNYAGQNSDLFVQRYRERYGEDPATHAPNAYDCAYALALSMLVSGDSPPGRQAVHQGMPRFKQENRTPDEVVVAFGPDEFARAAEIIRSGGRVDLEGASGRLLFDTNGDRPRQGTCLFTPNPEANDWEYSQCYDADMNPL